MLAFLAVVMPRSWMEAGHEWFGMGLMPEGAVVGYMIRQASYTYGAHGVLLWLLSYDPERFRPIVLFSGACYLLGGPVFLAIDAGAGMPWFWTVGDAGGCFAFGAAVLWLARRGAPARDAADSPTPRATEAP